MNNSTPRPISGPDATMSPSEKECSKKHALSLSEGIVQSCPEQRRRKGRSRFDARSVLSVRERECREERQVCEPEGGKMGRTPLAAFFNIPKEEIYGQNEP